MSADIASAYGPVSEALLRDLEAYEGMKDELLRKYRDKVVAIKDGELVGVYENEVRAYEDVVRKHCLVPVLMKRVREVEETADMSAYVHGLVNARPV
ncbi:MAG: hypothetical protein ACP5ID_06610 [Conexivisphaera sp.]